jgi:hypothetical protein
MLLRNKKTHENEQNWCVVLNPLRNEIDKKRVAQRISQVFSLSSDEASDLVENTPIIILDNLTHSVASKLREYFRSAGAETILTNDVFQKRKCYRTVWPEPPNLSFLHTWDPSKASSREEILNPEDALHEIRSLAKESHQEKVEITPVPVFQDKERENLLEEAERWRRECQTLREECSRLKEEMGKMQSENFMENLSAPESDEWDSPKEKEIKEARLLLSHANEKYEVLKEEYREARRLYEEKIGLLSVENEQSRRKAGEMTESLRSLQAEKSSLQELMEKKERDLQTIEEHHQKTQLSFQQKNLEISEENIRLQAKVNELEEKIAVLGKAKEALDETMNMQSEQIREWREKHDALIPRLLLAEKKQMEEKALREKAENEKKDLERSQGNLSQDREAKEKEIQSWGLKCLELDKQIVSLRESFVNQEGVLQATLRQLEMRERELENARRQVREINSQIEQREAVQKRIQLVNQLTEKEAHLKKLVSEQEQIEAEIKNREEAMRRILSEQEKIEREIIEGKQAQRHLAEQAKREGTSKIKVSKEVSRISPHDIQAENQPE